MKELDPQPTIDELPLDEWQEFVEEERYVDPDLVPDRVLPLAKSKYPTKKEADARFAEIKAKHDYILIDDNETIDYWVYRVLDRITKNEAE